MTPYRIGKDEINDELDAYLANADNARRLVKEIKEQPDGESTFMGSLTPAHRERLRRDVYGPGPKPGSGAELQRALARASSRKKLFRDGVVRAIELALDGTAGREIDPIESFWGCGYPKDEVRVGRSAPGAPVTLMLLSDRPAMGGNSSPHRLEAGRAQELLGLPLKTLRGDDSGSASQAGPFTP